MWDTRYSEPGYAYGTAPNDFLLASHRHIPRGRVLSLAEGEGRNAVFLARQGYDVTAVDTSAVGLRKAGQLAREQGVSLQLVQADLGQFSLGTGAWDGIISIFVPLPSTVRKALYQALPGALKPGGVFLLEAYTPAQLQLGTGGGSNADVMQTAATLREELPGLHFVHLLEGQRDVVEGRYHTGPGAVVQAIARRPA